MTYAEFVARLQAALVEDGTTDDGWAVYLPAIIDQAELRCYRDVDFLAVRKRVTVTLASGVEEFAAPADWMLGENVYLVQSGVRVALRRREASYLREYGTTSGQPKLWAEPTQGRILLAPTPNATYSAELDYHYRPAPMSATNVSTWLSVNAPDLLFYSGMIAATGYQKNWGAQADDPKAAMSWANAYAAALSAVMREESRRKGVSTFDPSPSAAPTNNAPARG